MPDPTNATPDPIPQALQLALQDLQQAKDACDQAQQQLAADQAAADGAAQTVQQDQAAFQAASQTLNQKRQAVEALMDSYYTPGGTLPPPAAQARKAG